MNCVFSDFKHIFICQVDMMGIMQPVCQLHSTKAFGQFLGNLLRLLKLSSRVHISKELPSYSIFTGQFLADLPNYKKPAFIKHILRSNES